MRAPFSEMLPIRVGVSILTRGPAAIAASRLTTAVVAAGCAGALAVGAPPAGGAVWGFAWFAAGVADLASSVACCAARCFSIAGTL